MTTQSEKGNSREYREVALGVTTTKAERLEKGGGKRRWELPLREEEGESEPSANHRPRRL